MKKEEQDLIDKSYKCLGWQSEPYETEEWKNCHNTKHKIYDKQHTPSGSNCTSWCDICKIYWKTDMSG